ncbi:MAG: Hsp20/alpha crystallin family protein [Verrucomicrobia bacterium]|nr:Hsp20/alpha crystallin family protein [Verrucomicrobiota bacterium]
MTSTTLTTERTLPTETERKEYMRPRYEVSSSDHEHRVRVYLPGVPREQASITLESNTLIVEGMRADHWTQKGRALHREIPASDYRLRLQLNVRIDDSNISANHTDGVLTITLPVAEAAKPRSITIG